MVELAEIREILMLGERGLSRLEPVGLADGEDWRMGLGGAGALHIPACIAPGALLLVSTAQTLIR